MTAADPHKTEAKAKGLTRYFTGRPCKYGHIAERLVANAGCIVCQGIRRRALLSRFRKKLRNTPVAKKLPKNTIISRAEAASRGLRRYFTGKSCSHGHISERSTVNGTCCSCALEWMYDPQKARVKRRAHYVANRAELLKKSKAESQTVKGRLRRRVSEGKRRTMLIGTVSARDIEDILARQRQRCANPLCRVNLKKAGHHLDHIVPVTRKGSHERRNIQALCPTCNMRKHNKDPLDWARENGLLL